MGFLGEYGYIPSLKPCSCNVLHNLPMLTFETILTEWARVECDFCGNSTRNCSTIAQAEFRWNEFDSGKGLLKKKAKLEDYEIGVGIF